MRPRQLTPTQLRAYHRPTIEPFGEPATEPAPELPASEPAVEPIDKSFPEQPAEPVAEPAIDSTVEPVTEPTAEPAAEPIAAPIPEEMSETPSKSKKKKKKKKGAQSEDPLSSETPEISTLSEEPLPITSEEVEQSGDAGVTKDLLEQATESLLVDESSPEELSTTPKPEPELVPEQETAETPKGKKKKKRKSVHWEPEDNSTPPAAAQEDTTPTPPSEDIDKFVDAEEASSVPEGSQEDRNLTTEVLEPDSQKSLDEQPAGDLSDDALSAWDIGTDTPENTEDPDEAESKTDALPDADNVTREPKPPAALESFVSEPLFSQGDAPVEDSQATSIDFESAQPEESSLVPEEVGLDTPINDDAANVIEDVKTQAPEASTTTETTEATEGTSKKKAKKNKKKKKNQGAEEEMPEVPQAEEPSPAAAEPIEKPYESLAEEPKPEELSVQPIELVEDFSADKSLEAPIPETPEETRGLTEGPVTDETKFDETPIDPAQVIEDFGVHKPVDDPIVNDSAEATRDTEISEVVQEVPAGEETVPISGKKSKKKKKKSKSVSLAESDTVQDSPLENSEQSSLTQEPLTEEPLTQEPLTEEALTQEPLTVEPLTQEPLTEEALTQEPLTAEPLTAEPLTEEPLTQEPLTEEPITQESLAEDPPTQEPEQLTEPFAPTEAEPPVEEETVISTPPVEETGDSPPTAEAASVTETAPVEPEAEPEAPKKGKKNKKKKKKNSLSLDDAEKQPEGEPAPQEPSDETTRELDLNGTKDTATDETSSNGVDMLAKGSEEPVEALPPTDESTPPLDPEEIPEIAPESDEQTKPADLQTPLETPPVQDLVDAPAAETPDASASDQPSDQPPAEPPVPATEDPESLPTKKSKKDKKKKKKKAALEETTEPESGIATPSEETSAGPTTDAADSAVDKAADPSEDTPPEPETTETPTAELIPEVETTIPADVSTLAESNENGEPASSLEPDANPEDERDNDSQILQDPKTSPLPEPEPELEKKANAAADVDAGNLGLSEKDKEEKGKESVVDLETPVEFETKKPEREAEKQENDDEYAGLSKKQKKKMMRAKALAALESSVEPETPKEPEVTHEVPTESAVEPDVEPESKPEPETGPAAESTAEPDIDSGLKLENEATSTVEPESETVPIVEPETEAESKPETETQPLVDPETQSSVVEPLVVEPAADPNLETKSKPEHENELADRTISDAPEPELDTGEKHVLAEPTKLTAEPEIETESKPDPELLPTPTETPVELIETAPPTEPIIATEEKLPAEFEINPAEKLVEEEAPALSKKDKKKKKKKGKGQEAEPSRDVEAPKETDSAGPVDTPEPSAESATQASDPALEPTELKAEAIDPAVVLETNLDTKLEDEAQEKLKDLGEWPEPARDVLPASETEIETVLAPEAVTEAEPESEKKDDDNTNSGLTKKEKRKKKKKGKRDDLEASQELEQPKVVDITPEPAPIDDAQTEAAPIAEATPEIAEPSSETVDATECTPDVIAETETKVMAIPEPTLGAVAPEHTRGLEPETTFSTEPSPEAVDPLDPNVTPEDVIAEPEPESKKKEEEADDLTLSKKDKENKKKGKGSTGDPPEEPELPMDPMGLIAPEADSSEPTMQMETSEPTEPAETAEVVEPLESARQAKTSEIAEPANVSEPAQTVDVVEPADEIKPTELIDTVESAPSPEPARTPEPAFGTVVETDHQLEPEPEQTPEDDLIIPTSKKNKKKKKKGKASSSTTPEEEELVKEPEAPLELAPEPASDITPDPSSEPVVDPAPGTAELASKPPFEEPQQDVESGPSLSRSIDLDQEKTPASSQEAEIPTEPASDSSHHLEAVVAQAQPEPEALPTPEPIAVSHDDIDPYAGLSKKEIKKMKKKAKAAAANLEETPESTQDTPSNENTSEPLQDAKVDTAGSETTPTQKVEPVVETEPTLQTDLAPEVEKIPELEVIREAEPTPEAEPTSNVESENVEQVEMLVPEIIPTLEAELEVSPEPDQIEEDEQSAPLSNKQKKKKKKKGKSVAVDLEETHQPTEDPAQPPDLERPVEPVEPIVQDVSLAEPTISEKAKAEFEPQPEIEITEEGGSSSLGHEEDRETKVRDIGLAEKPEIVAPATKGIQHDEPEQAVETLPLVAETFIPSQPEPLIEAQPEVEQKDGEDVQTIRTSKQDKKKKKKKKKADGQVEEMELEEQAQQSSAPESAAEPLREELSMMPQVESRLEPSVPQEADINVTQPPVEHEAESHLELQAEVEHEFQHEFDVEPKAEIDPEPQNEQPTPREAEATIPEPPLESESQPLSESQGVKQEDEVAGPSLSKKDKKKKKKKGKASEGELAEPAEPVIVPESAVESIELPDTSNEPEPAHESPEAPQELNAIPEQPETTTEPETDAHLELAEPTNELEADIEVSKAARELEPAAELTETATKLEFVPESNASPELTTAQEAAVEPSTPAGTANELEAERTLDPEFTKELEVFTEQSENAKPLEPAHEPTGTAKELETATEPIVETEADPGKTEEDDLWGPTAFKKAKKQQKAKLAAQAEEYGELTAQSATSSAPMQLDVEEAVNQNSSEAGHPGLEIDHELNDPQHLDQAQLTDKDLNELQNMNSAAQVEDSDPFLPTDATEDVRAQPFDFETPADASMIQPEGPSYDAWAEPSVGKRSLKDEKKKKKKIDNIEALPEHEPSSYLAEMDRDVPMTEPAPLTEETRAESIQPLPEAPMEPNEAISILDEPEQPLVYAPSRELNITETSRKPSTMEEVPIAMEVEPTINEAQPINALREAVQVIRSQSEDGAKEVDMGQPAVSDIVTHQETPTEELQDKDLETKTSKKDKKKKKKKGTNTHETLELAPEAGPAPGVEPMDVDISTPAHESLEVPVDEMPVVEATPVDSFSVQVLPVEDISIQESATPDAPGEKNIPKDVLLDDIAMHDASDEAVLAKEAAANDPPAEDAPVAIPALDETAREPDSEVPVKKSKKDKKKAKKSLILAESSPAAEPIIEEQQQAPLSSSQETTHAASPMPTADKYDAEWALPAKKMSNKSTLGGSTLRSVPNTEMDLPLLEEPIAAFVESQRAIEPDSGFEPSPMLKQTSIDVEVPQSMEPTRSLKTADEEWGLPLKRKGKEGKMVSSPILEHQAPEPMDTPERSHERELADDEPKDSPTSNTTKKKKKERKLSSVQTQQPTPEVTPELEMQPIKKSMVTEELAAVRVDNARDLASTAISRDVAEPTDTRERETPYEDFVSPQRKASNSWVPLEEPARHGHKKNPKPVDTVEGSGPQDDELNFVDDWVAPSPSLRVGQAKTSTRAPVVDSKSFPVTPPRASRGASKAKSTPDNKGETSSASELVAAVAAAATGAAVLADKLGSKKKGKGRNIADERRQHDDDLFEDSSLRESGDKKGVNEDVRMKEAAFIGQRSFHERKELNAKADKDFWGASGQPRETSKETKLDLDARDRDDKTSTAQESSRTKGKGKNKSMDYEPAVASNSFTEPERDWKETSRHSARLDNDDMAESPVLGRGNTELPRSTPQGLLRRGSDMEDPDLTWATTDDHLLGA
ncbi:hypothetical protein G7Z17_g13381 [Cylindrodendrum hubeiense]|uniref:Uncharacterized protein n=1 Tax=Cylindrodendrum hubeiense TaxID=595255 RepID=A0A9P5GX57_9HYPO|nr:hypothetical protein G7Z17_g13381 [Cylindrodendrum hubeiense]